MNCNIKFYIIVVIFIEKDSKCLFFLHHLYLKMPSVWGVVTRKTTYQICDDQKQIEGMPGTLNDEMNLLQRNRK